MLAETPADIAYVTTYFAPLAAVTRPNAAFGIALPAATYRLPDGSQWFARDVWRLPDDAGAASQVRGLFSRRYVAACEASRHRGDVDQAWRSYLDGSYGACLRDVTPETIAAKQRLVARLTSALSAPQPGDPRWRTELRSDVEALDGLERPFAACDRVRFGPTTRDRLITTPRERYPDVFAADAPEGPGARDNAIVRRV